ncbi:MAG: SLC13 family permease [Opitutus sp.]
MHSEMVIVLAIILGTFALIATGRVRSELAALGGCCLLVITGVLSTQELFPALSSDAVVTVGAMFVLSSALARTGVIDSASRLMQRLPIRSEFGMLCLLLPSVLAVSAFVNNTPVVVVFLPIIVSVARRHKLATSKLLLPLSFASILGGTATLIGTSTNLVASTSGSRGGLAPIGMFEMTGLGLILAAVGLVYLLVFAPRFLPVRHMVSSLLDEASGRHFLTEAFVPAGSGLIGRTGAEALAQAQARGRIVEILRGGDVLTVEPAAIALQAGDRLRINVDAESVGALKHRRNLRLHRSDAADLAMGDAKEIHLIECIVGPRSGLIGRTLRDAELPRRDGVVVLALHRKGVNLREHLEAIALESGDVLLIEATEEALAALRQSDDVLLLAGGQRLPRRHKRWIAVLLIVAVVSLSALQLVPITIAAMAAAILVVVFGCIDAEEAYRAIDWPTLLLIAGTLAMGAALEKTHTAELAAGLLVSHVAQYGPWVALSLIVLVASLLTNFLSNNAVAALLVPLAIEAANIVHASPRAFLMAVTFGASACFATPIGYQTNTLVFAAGGYRFSDFVKFGLPLNVLYWLVATALIPFFWPLT